MWRRTNSEIAHIFSKLRVLPQPCVGYTSPSSVLCVPLQYNAENADFSPFTFKYFSGGTLQSKSVTFNDGFPANNNLFDLNCPFLNCPGGGYDLFFGSSDTDELLWNSLFSPNSTYFDPYTRAVFIAATFYEPSVQVSVSCITFNPSRQYANYTCAAEICRYPFESALYSILGNFAFDSLQRLFLGSLNTFRPNSSV